MIEGQLNFKDRNPSLVKENFLFLENLINRSADVDLGRLDNALKAGSITKEEHAELVYKFAGHRLEPAVEGLANAGKKLEAQAEELAIDPLTKFFGRALLEPKLNGLIKELNFSELHHRKSDISAIMVITLDMNGLKFFNDNYNHIVGDHALVALAERLKKVTRRNDILFRPGGDEFTILLPIENKEADFKEIFEKFKHSINADLSIIIENDGKNFLITTSMGYSVLKKGDFKEAKELLYEADKNERKNNKEIKSMKKI
ncbi:MAG: diguanylate cyclase [bacterium]